MFFTLSVICSHTCPYPLQFVPLQPSTEIAAGVCFFPFTILSLYPQNLVLLPAYASFRALCDFGHFAILSFYTKSLDQDFGLLLVYASFPSQFCPCTPKTLVQNLGVLPPCPYSHIQFCHSTPKTLYAAGVCITTTVK